MKKIKSLKEETRSPYDPPKTDSKREYDRWLETINNQHKTDWADFIFVVVMLFIFLFQPFLIKFFTEIILTKL